MTFENKEYLEKIEFTENEFDIFKDVLFFIHNKIEPLNFDHEREFQIYTSIIITILVYFFIKFDFKGKGMEAIMDDIKMNVNMKLSTKQ